MNRGCTFHEAETDWQTRIRTRSADQAGDFPVLTVCGASGVGKTSVVRALAKTHRAYIETTDGNPHLKGLFERSEDFNAAANQEWFLERICEHSDRTNPG